MSALGQKQTFAPQNIMSALLPKANIFLTFADMGKIREVKVQEKNFNLDFKLLSNCGRFVGKGEVVCSIHTGSTSFSMSALLPKARIQRRGPNFSYGPGADSP
jgi:hypothetical protein